MPANVPAFLIEEFVEAGELAYVCLDLGSVGSDWLYIKSSTGKVPADLHQLGLRHCFHDLFQSGRDRGDGLCSGVRIDPVLALLGGEVGLANPFTIFERNDVRSHCVGLRVYVSATA